MRSGRGGRRRIRRPRMRGRIGSRGPSMGSGIGHRSSSMKSGTGRRSSSMGSGIGRRSPSQMTFRRGSYGSYRRRPTWRARGMYPRRYSARPRSSIGCIVCFIILAAIVIIEFLPSFVYILAPEFSTEFLMLGVFALFVIALCFITQAVIDDDDEEVVYTGDSSGTTTTDIGTDTILVTCPYCGHKNPQDSTSCQNCDAEF
ncbi:MAG: hypothetical protein ACFFF4_11250 [Candidatus Thorarchaeota archaeon]